MASFLVQRCGAPLRFNPCSRNTTGISSNNCLSGPPGSRPFFFQCSFSTEIDFVNNSSRRSVARSRCGFASLHLATSSPSIRPILERGRFKTQPQCMFARRLLQMSFQDFDGSARRASAPTKSSSQSHAPGAATAAASSQHWDEGPSLHMSTAESEYDCSVAIARGNISQMVSNVSVIRRLQGILGTVKDTPEHRSRLHLSIEQTKKLAQDTKALLHRIGSMGGYQDTGDSSQKHEQRKLGDDLQRVLKSFRDAVTESLKRERSTCAAAKEHAWSHSDEEKVGLLETSRQQQMMQVASDLEFNEAMIAEREQGIQEVEKAVREVNEIFKDLSLIVSQQGEQIEEIGVTVSNAGDRVRSGMEELKEANESQNKARRTMLCLAIALVFIIFCIVVFLLGKF